MAGVFAPTSSVATPNSSTGAGIFANNTSPTPTTTAAPSASGTPTKYFYAADPKTGATIGVSNEDDPYSGKPYFAYRLPGSNATTTDPTRVGTTFDPRVAQPEPDSAFTNERMPESASEAVRSEDGAGPNDQLDHWMALAVGGANSPENLRVIPTSENQASSQSEGDLQKEVSEGKESLFQAQATEANNKGMKAPFTDYTTSVPHAFNIIDYIKGAFEKLPSELAGIHNPF